MNNWTMMGRLTGNPEIRYTKDKKAIAKFRVAVKRLYGDATDFFNCVAFDKTAEFIDQWFHKGMMIAMQGHGQNNNWTDKDGKKRYEVEFAAEHVWFGEAKKREQDGVQDAGAFKDPYIEYGEPDELPF